MTIENQRYDDQPFDLSIIDPFSLFTTWFLEAQKEIGDEFNSFALATALDNQPTARMVYLKEYSEQGFIFYTNGDSIKAKAINQNNKVSMLFYWQDLAKQIIIQGNIKECSTEISDRIFAERDMENQLASIVSKQGQPLDSRETLIASFEDIKQNTQDSESIQRPDHCKCYIIEPTTFEFLIRGIHRLNYRQLFTQADHGWQNNLLYP